MEKPVKTHFDTPLPKGEGLSLNKNCKIAMAAATAISRHQKAIAFWFLTEVTDIDRATRSDDLSSETLKAKYASLKSKMKTLSSGTRVA